MAKLIDKYLKQIEEKLIDNSIASEFIEEFIDNLTDQLTIMLEEIQDQEPKLTLEDAEVRILTQCESVDIVVKRVVRELKEYEPRITADHISEIGFLRPVETLLLTVFKKIELGLIYGKKQFRKFSRWYLKHENPVFTSIMFFFIIFALTCGTLFLFTILPHIYQITTYPDNRTYYSITYDEPSTQRFEKPGITSISMTDVSITIQYILILLLVFGIIGYISWRYSTGYALTTGTLLGLLISSSWIFMAREGRLDFISYRTVSEQRGWAFTQDWIMTTKPTIDEFADVVLNTIISTFATFIATIIILVLLVSFLRLLIQEASIKYFKTNKTITILKIGLLISCLAVATAYTQMYPDFPTRKNVLLPTTNEPIIYDFDIDWTAKYSSRNMSSNYVTVMPEFGNLSFFFYEFYNLSFTPSITIDPDPLSAGLLSPVIHDPYEPSKPSQQPFHLLGLLYLPNQYNGMAFEEIVSNLLNQSYPFQGFTPTFDSSIEIIEWYVNSTKINLTVNTVRYNSLSNDSEYIFSFDQRTGWLMKAELIKDSDTWVRGFELNTLTITRSFTYNLIDNPEEYYSVDLMLTLLITLGVTVIFVFSGVFYFIKQKVE
ncbi:MAG: hypothetical protein ACFFAE_21135 [Candidatus Hodarchaeota archaeon]